MIHFCTVKFGKTLLGQSITELLNDLTKDIRNVKFHCYTEDEKGLDPKFNIIPLSKENINKHIHWNMMNFFNGHFINAKEGDETIYMDIDVSWNYKPSPMISYPIKNKEFLAIYRNWQNFKLDDKCELHDSFIKFKSHQCKHIYLKYFDNPQYWQQYYFNNNYVSKPRYGVQNFIWENVKSNMKLKYFPPHWIMKSHPKKHKIYAKQYKINVGRNYYSDFEDAILHFNSND